MKPMLVAMDALRYAGFGAVASFRDTETSPSISR